MPDPLTIITVAVPLPLDTQYSYAVPEQFGPVSIGMRVLVPFGRRTVTGYITGFSDTSPGGLKEAISLLDREPLFTPAELEFFRWTAEYYLHPLGEVIKAALPSGINITGKKRLITLPDGTAVSEEIFSGGRTAIHETFYRAAEPPAGGR